MQISKECHFYGAVLNGYIPIIDNSNLKVFKSTVQLGFEKLTRYVKYIKFRAARKFKDL